MTTSIPGSPGYTHAVEVRAPPTDAGTQRRDSLCVEQKGGFVGVGWFGGGGAKAVLPSEGHRDVCV